MRAVSTRPRNTSAALSTSAQASTGARVYRTILVVLWLGMAGTSLYWGLSYYTLPLQEKAYSDLHELFRPAGLVGHGFGIVGSLFMIAGVGLYSARKRVAGLGTFGKLRYWLDVHIFLCTIGPFLVLLHTAFKFGGIISIAFWSMTLVVLSGIFGRYVYARIPKTINGQFISRQAIRHRTDELHQKLRDVAGLEAGDLRRLLQQTGHRPPRGFFDALLLAARYDLQRRRRPRQIDALLARYEVPAPQRAQARTLLLEHLKLEQQIALLHPFQKLFGYWHVFHLPLAIIMFLIMILHVAVAAAFGYVWIY